MCSQVLYDPAMGHGGFLFDSQWQNEIISTMKPLLTPPLPPRRHSIAVPAAAAASGTAATVSSAAAVAGGHSAAAVAGGGEERSCVGVRGGVAWQVGFKTEPLPLLLRSTQSAML